MTNITSPIASGSVFATDTILGVEYPRSKLSFGPSGTANDVSSTNPLPITSLALPLPTGAASEITLNLLLDALSSPLTNLPHEPTDDYTDLTTALITRTTAGITPIAAAVTGQSTRLHRIEFTCQAACTIEVQIGTITVLKYVMPAGGGYSSDFSARPLAVTGLNQALNFKTTGTAQVDAMCFTQTSVPVTL